MRSRLWFVLLLLGVAACGGGAVETVAPGAGAAASPDLSGLSLEVHQAPG